MISIIKNPYFALLWSGQLISAFGDEFYNVALLWLATKQAGETAGTFFGAATLCALLLAPLGGTLADKANRRGLLIAIELARGLLVGLLSILLTFNKFGLWLVVPFIFSKELLTTLFEPALQASLPTLAANIEALYITNNLIDLAKRCARMLCPAAAGLLLILLSSPTLFALNATSFIISAGAFILLGPCFQAFARSNPTIQTRDRHRFADLRKDILQSCMLAYRHRSFFQAISLITLMNIAWSIFFLIGLPLWTQQVLHAPSLFFGLMGSAYGIGSIAGLLLSTLRKPFSLRGMYIGKALQGVTFILLTLLGSNWAGIGVMFAGGLCSTLGEPTITLMIQTEFPQEHVGKLSSLRSTLVQLGVTLGSIVASPFYVLCGISTGIALSGCLMVLISVLGLVLPMFSKKGLMPEFNSLS
ncbi:MFS transporter [Ktedonosporobacter rubrisoli]|uniref:MFS transporter n=1 Tax=Ktedonosporobacter rubrisoli TaxID=2509675 RepID=A0A4P6JJ57_KTERU|nr:MFS transporter [Ktedonosporobacter rubrisoli]QBD75053.1 MFS transporter [Ktedonosporobacter rubrisoli]